MKKYFVTSDIHSFFDPFFTALINSGFSWYNEDHILIVCGDAFDRGPDSMRLLDFLCSLQELNRLILIRGNHDDLLEDLLWEIENKPDDINLIHIMNGTIQTVEQLTRLDGNDIMLGNCKYTTIRSRLSKYFKLIKQAKDFVEIGDYIFVHGWVPEEKSIYKASKEEWKHARWTNGMEAWNRGITIEGKTIVCGHWHTSYGNYNYHCKGDGEFNAGSDFGIFEDDGIIALDACTAYSKKVNIKILEI